MSIDLHHILRRLYPCVDFEVNLAGSKKLYKCREIEGVRKYNAIYVIENRTFEPRPQEKYCSSTFISMKNVERSSVNVKSRKVPQSRPVRNSELGEDLSREMEAYPSDELMLEFFYQSPLEFDIETPHQSFSQANSYKEYPVSTSPQHFLELDPWMFIQNPVFFDSWSKYHAIAIRRMAWMNDGPTNNSDGIDKHVKKAMKTAPEIIKLFYNGERLDHFAERMKVPMAYRSIYFAKTTNELKWLCNEYSLNNPEKRQYLNNLAAYCTKAGFLVNAEELAGIRKKIRRFSSRPSSSVNS